MNTESIRRTASRGDRRTSTPGDYLALPVFVVGCLAVGALGGWLTASSLDSWYSALERPPLTPPNWVFGPVWTTLYVLMATAAWLVWRQRTVANVRSALTLFVAQLVLNFIWSGLFFALQNPGAALVDIGILWATLGGTIIAFRRHSRLAVVLMVPYWAWVTFAVYLNGGFWWLNR